MTLTIDIPEEQTLVLKARAKAEGVSKEPYVRQVPEHELVPDWLRESRASATQAGVDRLSMEMDEIDAEIAAARKARR